VKEVAVFHRNLRFLLLSPLLAAGLLLSACGPDENTPYLKFIGGGFLFNYRLAEVTYGFVASVQRPLPDNSVLEARFEDPAGSEPIVLTQPTHRRRDQYAFTSPPVFGVKAKHNYQVELRLLDATSHQVLASYQKSYHADLDQSILPDKPPVIGPGYTPNPEAQRETGGPAVN
jgi:hypothetical protein